MTTVITGDQTNTVGVINTKTAVASTSGTSIDFTGIPAGVKRITVMFNGVSTNGTSLMQLQIGSGAFVATGYGSTLTSASTSTAANAFATNDTGLKLVVSQAAANTYSGKATIELVGSNAYVMASCISTSSIGASVGACGLTLSGTLDRVRITTVNGTDTFDAGSINILYE